MTIPTRKVPLTNRQDGRITTAWYEHLEALSEGGVGEQGPQGETGPAGPAGAAGATGATGATGPAGPGLAWTEIDIDFGSSPRYDASFTITDAAITSSSVKVMVSPSGKAADGRTADDWQWDGAVFAANPGTGSATVYATFSPGPIVGKRKIQYSVVA